MSSCNSCSLNHCLSVYASNEIYIKNIIRAPSLLRRSINMYVRTQDAILITSCHGYDYIPTTFILIILHKLIVQLHLHHQIMFMSNQTRCHNSWILLSYIHVMT